MKNCSICKSESKLIFKKLVLQKYEVRYYKCINCSFMFTEKPYWLNEAYSEAITATDLGLVRRNLYLKEVVEKIILLYLDNNGTFLDFAGGYGLMVRMLRDDGFNFYRQDEYCKNIFAVGFDIEDLTLQERNFQMVTAFEVFEHLEEPLSVIDKLFKYSNVIMFSTELIPDHNIENWWYLGLKTGQHVSFYTSYSLEIIANANNAHFYSDKKSIHLFVKKEFKADPFKKSNNLGKWIDSIIVSRKKKKLVSLLTKDVEVALLK